MDRQKGMNHSNTLQYKWMEWREKEPDIQAGFDQNEGLLCCRLMTHTGRGNLHGDSCTGTVWISCFGSLHNVHPSWRIKHTIIHWRFLYSINISNKYHTKCVILNPLYLSWLWIWAIFLSSTNKHRTLHTVRALNEYFLWRDFRCLIPWRLTRWPSNISFEWLKREESGRHCGEVCLPLPLLLFVSDVLQSVWKI